MKILQQLQEVFTFCLSKHWAPTWSHRSLAFALPRKQKITTLWTWESQKSFWGCKKKNPLYCPSAWCQKESRCFSMASPVGMDPVEDVAMSPFQAEPCRCPWSKALLPGAHLWTPSLSMTLVCGASTPPGRFLISIIIGIFRNHTFSRPSPWTSLPLVILPWSNSLLQHSS